MYILEIIVFVVVEYYMFIDMLVWVYVLDILLVLVLDVYELLNDVMLMIFEYVNCECLDKLLMIGCVNYLVEEV